MGKSALNVYITEKSFFLIYEIGGAEGNTNTNAATPINSGSITPESGKTTPPEGSIIPETEPTSPTAGIMMLKTHIRNMK